MRSTVLGFAIGIAVLQQQSVLPAVPPLLVAGALAGALLLAGGRASPGFAWRAGAGLLAGLAWAGLLAHGRLADALPVEQEGVDVQVTGVVATLPQPFDRGQRFEFAVEQASAPVPSRLSLAWYRGWRDEEWHRFQSVRPGERWRLTVKLKRPHGNANPHGFDYEAALFERGVRATGYVRSQHPAVRLDAFVPGAGAIVERLREAVRERFLAQLPDAEHAGVLVALAVGDQRAIPDVQWQLFNRTGTVHLMSISGLHVTMVAGLVYALAGFAWRRVPRLPLRLPAQKAAAMAGWAAAFGYCLLAGFGVPAQRTLYMLSVVALALLANRQLAATTVLALALGVVLLLDPWAVLSAGFWLSFGAVGLLFYASAGRLSHGGWLARWARAQWAVTLGMIPALLALFQQFSLVSPLANAVAVPVVSLAVTPLALLAAVVPFAPLLQLSHAVLGLLMGLLEMLADLPGAMWQQAAPAAWAVALGLAGCALMLLPRGMPARWTGAVLLVPLALAQAARPGDGELKLTVLDVGQGLAAHLQTRHHDLLYDTGPRYSAEADGGNRVIAPYLRSAGVTRLSGLVLSHADEDHAGGAESVLAQVPTGWLLSSVPALHRVALAGPPRVGCAHGQRWRWDGVDFEVLHPADAALSARTNALSCVLKASAAGRAVLLTADIESADEAALLARDAAALRAEVLVVPHHGSRSSSSAAFVAAVAPSLAVVPSGYRSRFGHPHAEVLARYAGAGAQVLRTDRDGAVSATLGPGGLAVRRERELRRRYWHDR